MKSNARELDNHDDIRALAKDAQRLLVPLADRLGLGAMRGMLEDACFRVLEPEAYNRILKSSDLIGKTEGTCLSLLTQRVSEILEQNGIDARVMERNTVPPSASSTRSSSRPGASFQTLTVA